MNVEEKEYYRITKTISEEKIRELYGRLLRSSNLQNKYGSNYNHNSFRSRLMEEFYEEFNYFELTKMSD
jgi:hypothetical protein